MRRAILIVDHGSRRSEANEHLGRVADAVRARRTDVIVETAHLEIAEPSIATGLERCVEAGAQTIVVHPYFLGPGRHTHQDIPKLVEEASALYPDVEIRISEPLGMHPGFIDAVERWVSNGD